MSWIPVLAVVVGSLLATLTNYVSGHASRSESRSLAQDQRAADQWKERQERLRAKYEPCLGILFRVSYDLTPGEDRLRNLNAIRNDVENHMLEIVTVTSLETSETAVQEHLSKTWNAMNAVIVNASEFTAAEVTSEQHSELVGSITLLARAMRDTIAADNPDLIFAQHPSLRNRLQDRVGWK